jgi:predicted regulator of Ras-like GTPase activity (Roadblock/LC7/MglB family)
VSSFIAHLREAERTRFTGRILVFAGAEQVGGAVLNLGRVGWAIHRAQVDNLGNILERLGPVSRSQLSQIRRAYDASDKRASFAAMLEQARIVPQPVFRRCLLLHNRSALRTAEAAGELRLERKEGAAPADPEMLFSLEELMNELGPEPSPSDHAERWRSLGEENRGLAPLAEVAGFLAAAALTADGQVLAAYAPDGAPDARVLAATLAGLAEAAGRAAAHSAMGGVQYVLVSGEAGTLVARWTSEERKRLVCALVAQEHQIGMAKYRINAQLAAMDAWLAERQEPSPG